MTAITATTDLPAALTAAEQSDLDQHEQTIERGLQTFYEVGAALMDIRERRLYRQAYPTFEAYCRERWGMTKSRANQLIDSSEVVGNLTTIVVKPTNEAQTRPLTQLTPEEQREAWQEAVATAPNGKKVTAAHVEQAARSYKTCKTCGKSSSDGVLYSRECQACYERRKAPIPLDPHLIQALESVGGSYVRPSGASHEFFWPAANGGRVLLTLDAASIDQMIADLALTWHELSQKLKRHGGSIAKQPADPEGRMLVTLPGADEPQRLSVQHVRGALLELQRAQAAAPAADPVPAFDASDPAYQERLAQQIRARASGNEFFLLLSDVEGWEGSGRPIDALALTDFQARLTALAGDLNDQEYETLSARIDALSAPAGTPRTIASLVNDAAASILAQNRDKPAYLATPDMEEEQDAIRTEAVGLLKQLNRLLRQLPIHDSTALAETIEDLYNCDLGQEHEHWVRIGWVLLDMEPA